jgi:hypothetical protein
MGTVTKFPASKSRPAAPLSRAELAGLVDALSQVQRFRGKCGNTAIGAYLSSADFILTTAIAEAWKLLKEGDGQ